MKRKPLENPKGITLIALVVTIIVLIILAGIAVSMTVGDNGIFTKAKEAKRLQITAEAKEKIGTEILDAQVEAVQKNEQLQQSKVEEIISKYGELQADGDTIKLKDNGYEISLKEIYNGTTSSGGSTGGSTGSADLDSLKAELAQTTATEDKVLKDYKAYSNGKLITGTMENYAGQIVTASSIEENGDNAEITIPSAGYYGTASKVSIPVETIKNSISSLKNDIKSNAEKTILSNIITGNGGFDMLNYSLYVGSGADGVVNAKFKNNGVTKIIPINNFSASCILLDGNTVNRSFTKDQVCDVSDILTMSISCSRKSSGGSGSSSSAFFNIYESVNNRGLTPINLYIYVGSGADGTSTLTLKNENVHTIKANSNISCKCKLKDGTTITKTISTNETDISDVDTIELYLSRQSSGGSGTSNSNILVVIS